MKRKKVITKERETSVVIYCSNKIRVSKELNGELFFEIVFFHYLKLVAFLAAHKFVAFYK
jgi:hypothetical protein